MHACWWLWGKCLEWRDQIFHDGRICYSAEPLGSARGTRGLVDADAGVLNKIDETQKVKMFPQKFAPGASDSPRKTLVKSFLSLLNFSAVEIVL